MENQDQSQHVNIVITDIQLHTTEPENPKPWYRMLMKSLRSKSPGRVFGKINNAKTAPQGQINLTLPPLPTAEELFYQMPELRGKIVHFLAPKAGIPIFAGKDTVEFIKARQNRNWTDKIKRFIGFDPSKRNNS